MNDRELVERLCALLSCAVDIVREQSVLLAMHGIAADEVDTRRAQLLSDAGRVL